MPVLKKKKFDSLQTLNGKNRRKESLKRFQDFSFLVKSK